MRIWYQSFLDPALHGAYMDRLRAYLDVLADPGDEFVLGGIRPADRGVSRLSEFRCAAYAIEHAILAERAGFDGVLIGHFQDSGLYEARSAVAIPVVGMGEATMLWAMTLGRSFAMVTIDPCYLAWHAEQAERCGLSGRCAGVGAISGLAVEDYVAAFETDAAHARFLEAFREAAAPLVRAGAEVIIPAGGLPGLLCARTRGLRIDGAVVLNPVAVSARAAAMAVALARVDEIGPSRLRAFAAAPQQAIDDLLALTAPTSDPELAPQSAPTSDPEQAPHPAPPDWPAPAQGGTA